MELNLQNQTVEYCSTENDHFINQTDSSNVLVKFSVQFSKIHGPLCLAVCAFGIPANLANIIVLTRKNLAYTATNHLLLWLAFSDLFLMIIYLPCLYHFHLIHPHPMKRRIFTPSKNWIYYQEIMVSATLMFHSLALWLTVLLAVFRFIHIGFPIHGSTIANIKCAFISVLITLFFCILFTIPNIMVNYIQSCQGPIEFNNSSLTSYYYISSDPENIYTNSFYKWLHKINWEPIKFHNFNLWLQAIITKIAPSFLLTLLTILLIHQLQLAIRRRKKLFKFKNDKYDTIRNLQMNTNDESKSINRENRTTLLLITIVSCCLCIELPQGLLVTCIYLIPNFNENVYENLGDLLDFLTLLIESINFIIYTTMSNKFRQTFCEIFFKQNWIKIRCKQNLNKIKKFSINHNDNFEQKCSLKQKHHVNDKISNLIPNDCKTNQIDNNNNNADNDNNNNNNKFKNDDPFLQQENCNLTMALFTSSD